MLAVSGCSWVGWLWWTDSFLSFLVLVESSYDGSILYGTKFLRTNLRVEKASTQFRGSLQVNSHIPDIF